MPVRLCRTALPRPDSQPACRNLRATVRPPRLRRIAEQSTTSRVFLLDVRFSSGTSYNSLLTRGSKGGMCGMVRTHRQSAYFCELQASRRTTPAPAPPPTHTHDAPLPPRAVCRPVHPPRLLWNDHNCECARPRSRLVTQTLWGLHMNCRSALLVPTVARGLSIKGGGAREEQRSQQQSRTAPPKVDPSKETLAQWDA